MKSESSKGRRDGVLLQRSPSSRPCSNRCIPHCSTASLTGAMAAWRHRQRKSLPEYPFVSQAIAAMSAAVSSYSTPPVESMCVMRSQRASSPGIGTARRLSKRRKKASSSDLMSLVAASTTTCGGLLSLSPALRLAVWLDLSERRSLSCNSSSHKSRREAVSSLLPSAPREVAMASISSKNTQAGARERARQNIERITSPRIQVIEIACQQWSELAKVPDRVYARLARAHAHSVPFSLSPKYLERTTLGLTRSMRRPPSLAAASASIDLPVPGGP